MERRIILRARAARDIIELADYIQYDNPEASDRFLVAMEAAFEFLADTPYAGAQREFLAPDLRGIRMWPVRGFERHLVFYIPLSEGVDIIRVVHSARDIAALFVDDDE